MTESIVAERIEVTGIVQGVGFRPFVYRLAIELGLAGVVGNHASMVFIEVQGTSSRIADFVERLKSEAPTLSAIATIERNSMSPCAQHKSFSIARSDAQAGMRSHVSPDAATCVECVDELMDPDNRRFGHAFISCTNCGPRFTIINDLPYDRPATTMADFALCGTCAREYNDPTDRRFHAQPVCCHDCGPRLDFRWHAAPGSMFDVLQQEDGHDPIAAARIALEHGAILAVKGTGGFQLVCDANNDASVQRLRRRKGRPDKPFAVVVSNLDNARELAHLNAVESEQLSSSAAPIVLLDQRRTIAVSSQVAPGSPLIGIMLANNPIHHLLLSDTTPCLVATSGNQSGNPIAYQDHELGTLEQLVDASLTHDRPINVPCDDSVVRVSNGSILPIRRARGYAPIPLSFPLGRRNVLAVGAELKNSFCLASSAPSASHDPTPGVGQAWMSQHIGQMGSVETLRAFESLIEQFRTTYEVEFDGRTDVLACDLHPDYLTTRWSENVSKAMGIPLVRVQHHHAHVAAVMAEHGLDPAQPVLGFAFDGTGFGADGTTWGGEILAASAQGFKRLAHLSTVSLPGHDEAARAPFRSAAGHLHAAKIPPETDLAPMRTLSRIERGLLDKQLRHGFGCSTTSSMGRLFDAVASLLGLRQHISFEAQAAIELEHLAMRSPQQLDEGRKSHVHASRYGFELEMATDGGPIIANPAQLLRHLIADHRRGMEPMTLAWHFHRAVADLVVELSTRLRSAVDNDVVVLSGGVFQNSLLTSMCVAGLKAAGLRPLTPRLVPANDGGLALGQAYIAAHMVNPPRHALSDSNDRTPCSPSSPFVSLLGATDPQ